MLYADMSFFHIIIANYQDGVMCILHIKQSQILDLPLIWIFLQMACASKALISFALANFINEEGDSRK